MDEDFEVQLLDFLRRNVRDDLLDGPCSQPVLDEAAVLELVDDEVVAVLLVLLHVDDGVVLPELLDADDLPVVLELLDVDDLPVLLELLYDDVADAQFESLDALDELADAVGLDVGCQCQSLRSRCPTLLLLQAILDALFQDADVGTILLHSMDVLLHIPNHDADDHLEVGPNDVLNISNVDPDPDVANVLVDANVVMAGSGVAHQCRFRSRR